MANRNINKIPKDIYEKLKTIEGNYVMTGCAVKFKAEQLVSGKLSHLGIVLTSDGLQIPSAIVPAESRGKFSNRNINGFEVIRKDLPKETHYNTVESPNWGDSYYGTHTVHLPYKKYPRNFQSPRELEITIACRNTNPGLPVYIIAFQVKEILDKTAKGFESKLLENLNILQENIGACGVEKADTPIADYEKSLHVSWEILPPGTLDETIQRLFRGKTPTNQEKDVAKKRYEFFSSLNPQSFVFGTSGLRRYFGALIKTDLVVFENIEYGNAIYILFDNWEDLSKRSRLDLISGKFGTSFERIIHTGKWQSEVKKIIKEKIDGKKVVNKK